MKVDQYLKPVATVFVAALACFAAVASGPNTEGGLAQGAPEKVTYLNEYAAGEACEFPVRIEVNGKEKVIFLPGNRIAVASPGLRVTLTNLDEPYKQHTQVITGAVHVTLLENGDARLVFTGWNFLEGFDEPLPFLGLTVGRLSMTLDPFGNYVNPPSGSAKIFDACSLIE